MFQTTVIKTKKLSMKNYKFTIFYWFVCGLLFPVGLAAQNLEPGQITFHIAGLKATRANLNYYYGEQAFRADSAAVDTLTGTVRFSTKDRHAGMYFLSVKQGRLFDFILDQPDISFTVNTSIRRLDSLQAEGSPENAAFFQYKYAEAALKTQAEQMQANLKLIAQATRNDSAAMADITSHLRDNQKEMLALREQFVQAHPNFLFAKLLRAVQRPIPPTKLTERDKRGQPNPAFSVWLQQHYWDGTDFMDERLLYNSLWVNYLNMYFTRIVVPQPDSINRAIDLLLTKMPKDGAFYQFTVKHFTQRFEQSDWANADQVFVHLADTYQKLTTTPWLDQATLLRMEEKANMHRRNLTGRPAPPLSLPDSTGKNLDLKQLKTPYTLLIFYSPLCTHCQEAMPGVYQTWKDFAPKGLGAVAVSMENYDFWKKYVQQQGWVWQNVADPTGKNTFQKDYNAWNLPVIYLLDKDQHILRKRIRTTDLVEVLRGYLGHE